MTRFLVFSLAVWRLSSLLVKEEGPWHVFDRIRRRAGVYNVGEMSVTAELLSCVWCTSIHVSAALYAVRGAFFVHYILAASALAILFEERAPRDAR